MGLPEVANETSSVKQREICAEHREAKIEYDNFGFVKNYVCPHCSAKVKLDHVDDAETKWFKCKKCGQQSWKLKSTQLKCLEENLTKGPYLLHPSGGITDDFVYEPSRKGEYVYCTKRGKKGLTKIVAEYEDAEHKKGERWYIDIEDWRYYFSYKPPKKWLFNFPNHKALENWVEGKRASKQLVDIWTLTQIYFITFLDFPNPYEFSVAALFVVQTWLTELIPVAFYIMVKGEFGGGKSVSAEAICSICRHCYETGNLSPPFVARAIESQKLTLYVDELDSVAGKKDSDLYSIFRQGYRRGSSYSRINPDTLEPESHLIFGAKLYTVHTGVEQALQTRTVPLHVRETQNHQYPIINSEKAVFAKKLHTEYFLWYLDNALKLRDNHFEKLDALNILNDGQLDTLVGLDVFGVGGAHLNDGENIIKLASNIRKTIFEKKIALLKEHQVSQISQVAGRNVELAYLCYILSNVVNIDVNVDIEQAFKQKLIEEGERTEIGYLGTLKDLLIEAYKDKKDVAGYQTKSGEVMISNKELYALFNKRLKDEKLEGVSPHKFKEYLIEFGFTDALNRRKLEVPIPSGKKQSRMCNIFSKRVLKKLDIENGETQNKLNVHSNLISLENLVSVHWVDEPLSEHECGVCGYVRQISHKAITTRKEHIWICESCVQDFEAQRKMT